MIRASKPKRRKCPKCRRLINAKNLARHLRLHEERKLPQDRQPEVKTYGEYLY